MTRQRITKAEQVLDAMTLDAVCATCLRRYSIRANAARETDADVREYIENGWYCSRDCRHSFRGKAGGWHSERIRLGIE